MKSNVFKKFFCLITVLIISFAFCSCTDNESGKETGSETSGTINSSISASDVNDTQNYSDTSSVSYAQTETEKTSITEPEKTDDQDNTVSDETGIVSSAAQTSGQTTDPLDKDGDGWIDIIV